MTEKYIINKKEYDLNAGKDIWKDLEKAEIRNYPWDSSGYRPEMNAILFYTNDRIFVHLESYERYPRATYHKINEPVYRDSCQEFFLKPCPESDERYFNFEFNPWGIYLLGIGKNRSDRELIDEKISSGSFLVESDIKRIKRNDEIIFKWTIEFSIPFEFIIKFFSTFVPHAGKKMLANFYKCGNDTLFPHYGCWNKIINKDPDFHLSEYFGPIIME